MERKRTVTFVTSDVHGIDLPETRRHVTIDSLYELYEEQEPKMYLPKLPTDSTRAAGPGDDTAQPASEAPAPNLISELSHGKTGLHLLEFSIDDAFLLEYVFGSPLRLLETSPAKKEAVRTHESVFLLDALLAGHVIAFNEGVGQMIIIKQLLKNLRLQGLIYCHLRNELLKTQEGHQYIIVKVIVQRLSMQDDPDMSIVCFFAMKVCDNTAPVASYKKAYENRIIVEKIDPSLGEVTAHSAGKREELVLPDKMTPQQREYSVKINNILKQKNEMQQQLLQPAYLVNYFFDMKRITANEEHLSIPI
jgi:hypothetical protein